MLDDLILKLENVAQGDLRSVGPQNRTFRHLHELGGHPNVLAGTKEASRQYHIDVRFFGDPFEIKAFRGELGGCGSRQAARQRLKS